MKVFVVQAVSRIVPGTPLIPCRTQARANREAADLVRLLNEEEGAAGIAQPITPTNWRASLRMLRSNLRQLGLAGDAPDVWCDAMDLRP